MTMNKLFFIILAFVIQSCVSSYQQTFDIFEGRWHISEIQYDTINYKDYLLTNLLLFKENGKVSVPNSLHYRDKDYSAKWSFEIVEGDILLKLRSKNLMFNGLYDVHFFNEEGLKGMELRTDTVYIKAYKSEFKIPRW